jgi:hypothetical protein
MAEPTSIRAAVAASLARQIGEMLPPSLAKSLAADRRVELAESVPLCFVPVIDEWKKHLRLDEIAQPTGLWHHQIRVDGSAVYFARSRPSESESADWLVEEVVDSPIAKAIEETIEWADDQVEDDSSPQLLVAPAYYLHALWLAPNRVTIVEPGTAIAFERKRWYSAEEFVQILSEANRADGLPGMTDPNPDLTRDIA